MGSLPQLFTKSPRLTRSRARCEVVFAVGRLGDPCGSVSQSERLVGRSPSFTDIEGSTACLTASAETATGSWWRGILVSAGGRPRSRARIGIIAAWGVA
jgi:hypothetical protein